ncbi:MAG TPA: GNAT family N-acetyltransferase [Prolixibacteraceae bacterium]|nr:GNAT family N-acetyltransferase [Prolixibacteraceae bacterium]
MDKIQVIVGDINNQTQAEQMLHLLNLYMHDPMGGNQSMTPDLAKKNIAGLKQQSNYLFFIAYCNGEPAGLANCFVNYSTFKAKLLLNIHDFAVSPNFRRHGVGEVLMNKIVAHTRQNDFCKITLEVRHDNHGAKNLYQKAGFTECNTPMHFWELPL